MSPNPVYLDPEAPTTHMLKALADMDPGFVRTIGALIAYSGEPKIPTDILKYTFGPLIVHNSRPTGPVKGDIGWLNRALLDKYHPRVLAERIEILCGERPDLVSPTELWMVMYNAVHDFPLHNAPASIYIWAVERSMRAGDFAKEEILDRHKVQCHIVEDEAVFGGDWSISHEYENMAREIRRKVIAHSEIRRRPRQGNWTLEVRDQFV